MPLTHHPLSPYFPLSVSLFLLRSFFHSLAFFGQRSSTSGCLRVTDAAGLRNIFASTKKTIVECKPSALASFRHAYGDGEKNPLFLLMWPKTRDLTAISKRAI